MPSSADQPFETQLAAMEPRLTGRDAACLTISTTLSLEPWLLEALAAKSREEQCGLEDVIVAALKERFGKDTDESLR